jgi:hypothetical protein
MDAADFVRAHLNDPLPELLPWQRALYEGGYRRVVFGGGRAFQRRMLVVGMMAAALRSGETVRVEAATAAEASEIMAEARRLLEAQA